MYMEDVGKNETQKTFWGQLVQSFIFFADAETQVKYKWSCCEAEGTTFNIL